MFAYNPTVNDRSGEILGAGVTNAANIQAQGMQTFGQSVGQGLAAMGEGIAGGMNKAAEKAIKYKAAAGMLDAYRRNADVFGLSVEDLDAMEKQKINDPDALIGALTVTGAIAENNMSMKREQARMDGYKDLADYKSSLGAASTDTAATPKYDFNYATQFNKALYDNGITDPEQQKQKFNEAGIGHLYEKFINPPKQNMGFFGPVTQ